jgi:hypothetical protein
LARAGDTVSSNGHSSLAITDRYVRHIAPADVVATMRSREW